MPAPQLPPRERRLAKLLAALAVSQDTGESTAFPARLATVYAGIPASRQRLFRSFLGKQVQRAWQRQQLVIEHAGPLPPATANSVAKEFEQTFARKLRLQIVENPELIAGLRIRLDDLTFDSTVAGQLERLAISID